MWKCPECDEEIVKLNYDINTQSWEAGYAHLIDNPTEDQKRGINRDIIDEYESREYGDSEQTGDNNFTCPECSACVSRSDLLWEEYEHEEYNKNENEELEEKTEMITTSKGFKVPKNFEETKHNIIRPETEITPSEALEINNSSMICKECSHLFVSSVEKFKNMEKGEPSACPKCGTENIKDDYLILLKDGFFDKKPLIKKKICQEKKLT